MLGYSLGRWLKTVVMVMLGIIILKWALGRFKVPGLSAAVERV